MGFSNSHAGGLETGVVQILRLLTRWPFTS